TPRLRELLRLAAFARLRGRQRLEVEVLVLLVLGLDGDADQVLAFEVPAEDVLGERVLDVLLDRAAQRAGAEVGGGALVAQEYLRFGADLNPQPVICQTLGHL